MAEKQICCCGSGSWTRVIGWLQLVLSIIGIIFMGLLFIGSLSVTPEDYEKATGNLINPEDRGRIQKILTNVSILLGISLFQLVISLILAIILLKGSYGGSPGLLQVWVVVSSICLVLQLILSVVECFNGINLTTGIVSIVVSLVVGGFFIWVVNTHKNELKSSNTRAHPVTV